MSSISVWQLLIVLLLVGIPFAIYQFARRKPPLQAGITGPSGVAGWLLLLVLGLIFFGPLFGASRLNLDFIQAESQFSDLIQSEDWQLFKSATWWSFLAVACLGIYAGFGLARGRKKSVVTRAQIVLWVSGPGAAIVLGLFLPLIIFGSVEFDPQFFSSLIGSSIAAAIWTMYLSRSRRVKNTYFPAESDST